MNALELHELTKRYPDFVLGPVSLTLPGGCILGLVGENGAGKSTTIRLILDIVRKDGGSVTILGRDNQQDVRLIKEEVGTVLDEVGLSGCLNARQTGRIMQNTFRSWDQTAYQGYLEQLSVPQSKPFKEFSRGMKMKLGIAVALSHRPRLLILDEATNGLDPVARDQVLDLLTEFARDEEHSVLISSHIVSDLEKICDYIAFLHAGRLLLCEEKDALRERYGVLRCTAEQLAALPAQAVYGRRDTPYGVEALVRRDAAGAPLDPSRISPVSIEDLFVFMVKGGKRE